ncbi:serine hydrolase domain-containing protein [Gillisia sp. CAL575]|uniref:serine hydrolase domain-containing protein n=1 Tax=Gillisia sp. CAL575 TaxID=985255 RepID=UPI0003A50F40|nr:serine hydrolase domain-containing protein [Gillisia sp. CAL575]
MRIEKYIFLLISVIVLQSCGTAKIENSANKDVEFQKIIDSIYQINPKSVGIMVHIESPKKGISWSGSVGYSDAENKTKLVSDQPALIASSIKTYISASLLRLQEQNKLSIEDPIKNYLSNRTIKLFESDGYDLDRIKIKHLLSHTSGIEDYANDEYLDWVDKNQKHRWTRDEQLELTIKVGNPLGEPEDTFNYADANYLLCTEIIENVTNKPFYESIRDLLKYEELGFSNTWFPILETKKQQTKSLVHQYWGEKNWDSYNHDISWDLYGGGGIATTTEELARFSYYLFNNKIIKDKNILNQIFTTIDTKDGKDNKYGLGLSIGNVKGYTSYGHGGFWGTVVLYFPKLDSSIAVFILERDERILRKNVLEALVLELTKEKI